MSWIALVVAGLLLIVAAVLRAAGASLIRTPRADALHDAAEGNARAARVADLLEDPARIQPSLSMVHSTLMVGSALALAWALARVAAGWALLGALLGGGIVLVVLGDVAPRRWGRERPRRVAYRWSALLDGAVRLGGRAADILEEELLHPDGTIQEPEADQDEDRQDQEERELISSVLEFSDAIVREVMMPRTDMVTIAAGATTEEALDLVIERGYSRIPVRGESADDVVGIVYAKDLLRLLDRREPPRPVSQIMRLPYFVPETKRVAGLLREMQANKVHMAIAVDEFGGVAGLVTIEDLLEELVGEIIDEFDTEEPMAVPQRDGSYLVDARMPVSELGDLLGTELPDGDWDTVGGLVLGLAGRVPREGESFELDGIVLVPDRVQGRRIARVRVSTR